MANANSGRTVTMIFGVCFVVLAVAILVTGWVATPIGAAISALVVGLLGVDAIASARNDRPSIISRIGPLP